MNDASTAQTTTRTRAVWVAAKADGADGLATAVAIREAPLTPPPAGMALVEVKSAAINPSDVKAILGAMPHAVFPRTPGRDYAGIVVAGPASFIGKEVWGSGGDIGIRRDGSHARHLLVDATALREKPSTLTMAEAGAVGVPFVTAAEGLREAGGVKAGDVVLVCGANGKVGQAAIQIASMQGAKVFGVVRRAEPYVGHACREIELIDASCTDVAAHVRAKTGGHGADIVYNTVGSPYFEAANKAMAIKGRQILISTIERPVPFDIFTFYRGRHRYIGIDSLALDHIECAEILDTLNPGFESGTLRPFPVKPDGVFGFDRIVEAYRSVLGGSQDRIVLDPSV